jgi:tetratricopeptide (TPR) repeat protein
MLYPLVLGDPARGEASCRRAIELDPSRGGAREILLATLAMKDRDAEVLKAAQEYVRYSDTVKTRYLLAKAYENLHQYDRAEEQVRLALKQAPDDARLNLALAALLLKRGALAEAGKLLDRAAELTGKKDGEKHRTDYLAIRGVYLALSGDRQGAFRVLSEALEADKLHQQARAALEAMDQPPVPLAPLPWATPTTGALQRR